MISRLKLESGEFDSKIKRAAQGIQRLAEECHNAGGVLNVLEDENRKYIQSIGQMETVNKTARGSVAELTAAFMDMKHVYNQLSEEEKKGEVGQELNKQLGILKQRINEGNQEIKNMQQELNGGFGGALSQIKDKLTVNIDALKLFSVGLTVAKGALDVAKDAFFASEQNVDEWGRVVAASESVYEGFLTAINNGDISGFIGRIDQIVKAAREAYNELDRLGTMRTIQAPAMSKQETENNRMRMMIMTGRYIAPADGRKAAMADGSLLSPAQIRSIEQKLQNGMKSIVSLTKNELDQTGNAIDAYYKKLAVQNGMSLSEFRKGTSSMAEFDKRVQGAQMYEEWQMAHSFVDQSTGKLIAPRTGNPYAQFAGWNNFRVDKQGQNSYNDLVGLIKQQQQQTNQLYSTMGQAYRTINRAEGVTVRNIMNGGSGGAGGNGGSRSTFDISKIAFNVPEVIKPEDFIAQPSIWEQYAEGIRGTFDSIKDSMDNLTNWTQNYDPLAEKLEQQNKLLQEQQTRYTLAGQAAQNFGSALAGLEDPAAKAAGTVMQAIASIAMGFAMASSNANTAGTGWGWLAWLAAGTAAMATTISTIHSLTGYAEGGIVKGNSYSGDNVPALVDGSQMVGLNAGEVVLTQAMQSNLASNLRGNALSGLKLQTKVRGTELLVWLDNSLAQSGRGEMVTWGT